MDNKDRNKSNSTNQTRDNIRLTAQKNTQNLMRQIEEMRSSKEKMTFKSSVKYLWSFVILGINWMVYKKVFITLLTVLVLVGTLVWVTPLGIILCILTPVFLAILSRHLCINSKEEYSNVSKTEEQRLLIPSSLLIVWLLIGFMIILLVGALVEVLIL